MARAKHIKTRAICQRCKQECPYTHVLLLSEEIEDVPDLDLCSDCCNAFAALVNDWLEEGGP